MHFNVTVTGPVCQKSSQFPCRARQPIGAVSGSSNTNAVPRAAARGSPRLVRVSHTRHPADNDLDGADGETSCHELMRSAPRSHGYGISWDEMVVYETEQCTETRRILISLTFDK